ncbi:MAG: DUF115 domain-containing protein [Candidatus Gastranaerophilales bacterium]|nr:DUF115 domain-containing protein [Candidatus Gastranaerophilales bacterium]
MFNKNLEALEKINSNLAQRLKNIDLDSTKQEIQVFEAETKDLILNYKNINLHSSIDPVREANTFWNRTVKTDLKENDIQVMFGFGLGYLFKRGYVNSSSKILVFEPFVDILRFVFEYVDFSNELSDKRVFITDNVEEYVSELNKQLLSGDKIEFLFLNSYATLAKDALQELTKQSLMLYQNKNLEGNYKEKPKIWCTNFINNLSRLPKDKFVNQLSNRLSDKCALIIDNFASISIYIDKIKINREKFVLITSPLVYEKLFANSITPDFVIYSDEQFFSEEDLLIQTNVISDIRSKMNFEPKANFFYLPENYQLANVICLNIEELQPLQNTTKIVPIAINCANLMGCQTIALLGADFQDKFLIRQLSEILENDIKLTLLDSTKPLENISVSSFDSFIKFAENSSSEINELLLSNAKNSINMKEIIFQIKNEYAKLDIINKDAKQVYETLEIVCEEMEKQDADIVEIQAKLESISASLGTLRQIMIQNQFIATYMQNEIWQYTQNYALNILPNVEDVKKNMLLEKQIFGHVFNFSSLLLELLNTSIRKMETNSKITV